MSFELNIPKYDDLMWPTLCAVKELGGSGTIPEIVERVIEIERFSEAQQSVLHNDGPATKIEYRTAWARSYLKGIGALENSTRGVWSITDLGMRLTRDEMARLVSRYRADRRWGHRNGDDPTTQDEERESSGQRADPGEEWKDRLLQALLAMPPDGFERLAHRLLREAGFIDVTVTGRSGDGGIDGTGIYRLSLVSFPVFFQCKRWRGSVSASTIRDFRGAMVGRGDKGLVITTAHFTADALKESTRPGAPPIDLIDGERLCDLLKEYGIGVNVEVVEQITIDETVFQSI